MKNLTFSELVREYFPNATQDEVDYILWEYTGFPCFWETNDTEACLRKQLQEFVDELRAYATTNEVGEIQI